MHFTQLPNRSTLTTTACKKINLGAEVTFTSANLSSSVMLMDSGRILEYSPPGELLTNKKSSFYAMAKDAGIVA